VEKQIASGGVAGAVAVILIWIIRDIWPKIPVPPDVAAAITTLVAALAAWIAGKVK
jgi:hypothetical protein